MKIEEAIPSDAGSILNLQKIAYISEAELHDDFEIPPLTQTLEQLLEDFKIKKILKVEFGGQLIASGQVNLKDGCAHIGRIIVKPEHQGKGIGSKLMKALEEVYPFAISFEIFTGENSARNLGMYQRRGYKVVSSKLIGKTKIIFLSRTNQ